MLSLTKNGFNLQWNAVNLPNDGKIYYIVLKNDNANIEVENIITPDIENTVCFGSFLQPIGSKEHDVFGQKKISHCKFTHKFYNFQSFFLIGLPSINTL